MILTARVEGRRADLEAAQNRAAFIAHQTATLMRMKKIPPLRNMLVRKSPNPARPVSWQQQLAMVEVMHAMHKARQR